MRTYGYDEYDQAVLDFIHEMGIGPMGDMANKILPEDDDQRLELVKASIPARYGSEENFIDMLNSKYYSIKATEMLDKLLVALKYKTKAKTALISINRIEMTIALEIMRNKEENNGEFNSFEFIKSYPDWKDTTMLGYLELDCSQDDNLWSKVLELFNARLFSGSYSIKSKRAYIKYSPIFSSNTLLGFTKIIGE